MRLKYHKRSVVIFASRIIPHAKLCGQILCCKSNYPIAKGYRKLSRKDENINPTACFGVHIRD